MALKTKRKSSRKSSSTKVVRRASAIEALQRAQGNSSPNNEAYVVHHFAARGIDPSDITPRVNVLTFHAWRALGRSVRKGERGCTLQTWVPITTKTQDDDDSGKRAGKGGKLKPRRTTVFHISQTHTTGSKDGADPLQLHPDQLSATDAVNPSKPEPVEAVTVEPVADPVGAVVEAVTVETESTEPEPVAVESGPKESDDGTVSYWGW